MIRLTNVTKLTTMKAVLCIALCLFAVAFADETACPDTCNSATIDFCKDYIPASTFCYDSTDALVTPAEVDASCKEVANNASQYDAWKQEGGFTNPSSSCLGFFKSSTCTGSFAILTPPCDGSNLAVPCYSSCLKGYEACGLDASTADTACGLLADTGLYAAKDDTTCYDSFNAAGLVQVSAALFVAMIALTLF
jgi:hypothetical protein